MGQEDTRRDEGRGGEGGVGRGTRGQEEHVTEQVW